MRSGEEQVEPFRDPPRVGRMGRARVEIPAATREIAQRCLDDPGQPYRYTGPPTTWDPRPDTQSPADPTSTGGQVGPTLSTSGQAESTRRRLRRDLERFEQRGSWSVAIGQFATLVPPVWGVWVTYTSQESLAS